MSSVSAAGFCHVTSHSDIFVSSGRGSARDWNKSLAFQCLSRASLKLQATLFHADPAQKKCAS
jgi:hypothetical protein